MDKHPVLCQECKKDEHKAFRNRLLHHLAEGKRCELSLLSLSLVRVSCMQSLIQLVSCPCVIQDNTTATTARGEAGLNSPIIHPTNPPQTIAVIFQILTHIAAVFDEKLKDS